MSFTSPAAPLTIWPLDAEITPLKADSEHLLGKMITDSRSHPENQLQVAAVTNFSPDSLEHQCAVWWDK
jgi:hypothetical protein